MTSIESNTFKGCSSLIGIVIPEGVTSIGYSAFEGCSDLKSIVIPKSLTTIGNKVFYGCSSLTNIEIPETVINMGKNIFGGLIYVKADSVAHKYIEENKERYILEGEAKNISTNYEIKEEETWDISKDGDESVIAKWTLRDRTLKISGIGEMKDWKYDSKEDWHNMKYIDIVEKVIIEEGTVNIGEYAFDRCSELNSATMPDSVTKIGEYAFSDNGKLTSIAIPEGVTNIGKGVFQECISLTNIVIPEGVTSIGEDAFKGCSSLANIAIPEVVTNIGQGAFQGCVSLTNIDIPKGVKSINRSLFLGCSSLTNIEIPQGVTSIGSSAFQGCSSLTSIEISEGVVLIEDNAFTNCSNLESINMDINNKNYMSENGILFNKTKTEIICYPKGKKDMERYIIPEEVKRIRDSAFEGCNSLTNIVIPEGVTTIGSSAFKECNSLTDIIIPEGVISIGSSAFEECSSLTDIIIPEGVTMIGYSTFEGCSSLTDIAIPEGVTYIGSGAFKGCSSLTDIAIPEGITSIGNSIFEGCSSLTDIIIPKGVTSIESSAFEECSNLSDIEIPEGVIEIGNRAFFACSKLRNINIPNSLTNIEFDTFIGCNLIAYLNSNNPIYKNLEKHRVKYGIDDEGPIIKYTPNGSLNQQKEYNVKIEVEDNIKEVGINSNSLKFQWTQSINPPLKESFIDNFQNGEIINKNTGDGIWYLWVYAEDKLGNETIAKSEVFNFDNTAPNVNIKYSKKDETKENVTVTITSNEEMQELEGWTLSEDKRVLTKEYSKNTIEEIIIKDLAGNETTVNIEIGNTIDETPPIVEIIYSTKNPTKENVTVTIRANEEIQEVEGWTLSENKRVLTKEYDQNVTEEITIKDIAENETQVNIEIANIDKEAPDIKVEYSTKNPTKENVTVTITSNEEIQELEGWNLSEDKRVLTKEYTQNTEEEITIKDLAGNETQVSIEINNIEETVIGDINQDGKIDITDMLLLKRHLVAGNKKSWILTGNSLLRADINDNGVVDITDLLMLKRKIINSI